MNGEDNEEMWVDGAALLGGGKAVEITRLPPDIRPSGRAALPSLGSQHVIVEPVVASEAPSQDASDA